MLIRHGDGQSKTNKKTKSDLICSTASVFPTWTKYEGGQCFLYTFVQHIIKSIKHSSHPQALDQKHGPDSLRRTCKTNQESCPSLRTDAS